MRSTISDELLKTIDEKIYTDLEIYVLEKRLKEAETNNNIDFANYLNVVIKKAIRNRKELNDYLKQNGIKVDEPREIDDMFVEYKYYQKINGGFKEGNNRYWRAAILFQLKKRMKKYFGGDRYD